MTCGDIRRVITRRISPRIATSCCLKFSVKFLHGCHTKCLRYFWQNGTDYYDLVRVSPTFVRVLRHPYEIPLILLAITTCLYEFIRVLQDQSRVCTIYYNISMELVLHSTTLVRLYTIQCNFCTSCAAYLEYKGVGHRSMAISLLFSREKQIPWCCSVEPHRVPFKYSYHRSSMHTLPSHIATIVLVAICEGRVHMIFSWLSKGTHMAPLENNDIHVHLHTLYFQSFLTPVILEPKSFHTMLVRHRPEELYWGGSLWHPFVRLSNCLSVNIVGDGQEFFSYLHNMILKGTFWPSFKKIHPVVLEEMR